jgi:hypothetical protein
MSQTVSDNTYCTFCVSELHHFDATPAPSPTLPYSRPTFFEKTRKLTLGFGFPLLQLLSIIEKRMKLIQFVKFFQNLSMFSIGWWSRSRRSWS